MKIKAFSDFRKDEEAEENGKWAVITDGVEFKIRRMRSKAVVKARERIYGPYERAMGARKKDLPEQVENQCTVNLLSEAVLVDWRGEGMVDDDGKTIPFSPDAAKKLLSDDEYGQDLRAAVINLSLDGDFFSPEAEETKVDAGN